MIPAASRLRDQGLLFAYCLLNLLFFLTVRPYLPGGEELLTNRDFARGFDAWQIEGNGKAVSVNDGVLSLDHPAPRSTTLAQCWPRDDLPPALLLSAEGRSEGVLRGRKSWHEARIDLVGYDRAGQGQYRVRTRLLSLDGDRPWRTAEALFHPLSEARRVCLEISLYKASGRFQVRGLSLTRGVESAIFRAGRLLLLAGWLLLALHLGRVLYRHYRGRALGYWLLATAGAVLLGILMPHELRQQLETSILDLLAAVGLPVAPLDSPALESPWRLWPSHWDLSKFSHLIGFALLGMVLATDRATAPGVRIGGLLLLALTSEILQFYVPQRTPRLSDLVIDGMGIVIGMTLTWLFLRLRRGAA